MAKLIVLRLTGNLLEQGYEVTVEISEEGEPSYVDKTGYLPPNPDLAVKIDRHWREKYRNLVAPYRRKSWPVSEAMPESSTAWPVRINLKKVSYDGSVNARIRECKESADELQTLFRRWLESDRFRKISDCLRFHLNPGEAIRFLIRSEDTQLQKLPWHAWDLFKDLATEPSFSTPKQKQPQRSTVQAKKRSVRILAILGHSEGIDVEADRQLLQKLAPDTEFLVEPTQKAITDQLWEQPWDIIFFAGHSETEGDTGKIYINATDYLTVDELWYGLRKAVNNGLQIAIFNSCDGLGLARQLISDFQIPNLIVMRELVPDQVAQQFLTYFLSAFEGGRPFHLAAREARERLQAIEGQFPCASWLPTVYQNPLEAALYWQELIAPPAEDDATEPEPDSEQEPPSVPGRSRLTWKKVRQATAVSLLATSLVIGVRWLGVLEPMELGFYDHLLRARPAEQADKRLLIVEGTETDIDKYAHPLPDRVVLNLLEKISQHNPAAIGLSIPRDSPTPKDAQETHKKLASLIQNDAKIVAICSMGNAAEDGIAPPPNTPLSRVTFTNFINDNSITPQDYSIRRYLLYATPNPIDVATSCKPKESFGLKLARDYLERQKINVGFSESAWHFGRSRLQTLSAHSGMYQRFNAGGDQILLNYRNIDSPTIAQTVSVKDVLEGDSDDFDPGWISDRIVLIGMTAESVDKSQQTPFGLMSRLGVHAHLVSQLISAAENNRPMIRMPAFWVDLGAMILFTVLSSMTLAVTRGYVKTGLILGATIICLYLLSLSLFTYSGIYLPFIPTLTCISIVAVVTQIFTQSQTS